MIYFVRFINIFTHKICIKIEYRMVRNSKTRRRNVMTDLTFQERLIVAADYSPKDFGGIAGVKKQVLVLAKELQGTGVYIKVNSILRAAGYGLVNELHELGLPALFCVGRKVKYCVDHLHSIDS